MAEPIKISTSKYKKQGKVEIDGNIWSIVLPGAGTEMRFSQASRACKLYSSRMELIDKRIDSGKVTESDLDRYEEYTKKYEDNESILMGIFTDMFEDGTKDNSNVKDWVKNTPTAIIMMAFEQIKEQSEEVNGRKDETASA